MFLFVRDNLIIQGNMNATFALRKVQLSGEKNTNTCINNASESHGSVNVNLTALLNALLQVPNIDCC